MPLSEGSEGSQVQLTLDLSHSATTTFAARGGLEEELSLISPFEVSVQASTRPAPSPSVAAEAHAATAPSSLAAADGVQAAVQVQVSSPLELEIDALQLRLLRDLSEEFAPSLADTPAAPTGTGAGAEPASLPHRQLAPLASRNSLSLEVRLLRHVQAQLYSARGRDQPLCAARLEGAAAGAPLLHAARHASGSVAAEVQVNARLEASVYSASAAAFEPLLEPWDVALTARQQRAQRGGSVFVPGKWSAHADGSALEASLSDTTLTSLLDGRVALLRTLAAPSAAAASRLAAPPVLLRLQNACGARLRYGLQERQGKGKGVSTPVEQPGAELPSAGSTELELPSSRASARDARPLQRLHLSLEVQGAAGSWHRLPPLPLARSGSWALCAVPPPDGARHSPLYVYCVSRPLFLATDGAVGLSLQVRSHTELSNSSPEPLAVEILTLPPPPPPPPLPEPAAESATALAAAIGGDSLDAAADTHVFLGVVSPGGSIPVPPHLMSARVRVRPAHSSEGRSRSGEGAGESDPDGSAFEWPSETASFWLASCSREGEAARTLGRLLLQFPHLAASEALIESWRCALPANDPNNPNGLRRLHGTLHLTTTALAFASRGGRDMRELIPLGKLTAIQKAQTPLSRRPAIAICHSAGPPGGSAPRATAAAPRVLLLCGFASRDRALHGLLRHLAHSHPQLASTAYPPPSARLTARVGLQPGEAVLHSCAASLEVDGASGGAARGTLHLTDVRLAFEPAASSQPALRAYWADVRGVHLAAASGPVTAQQSGVPLVVETAGGALWLLRANCPLGACHTPGKGRRRWRDD